MNNKELIEKAVVTTDAIASTGKLNPVQSDRFLDLVVDITGLKGKVREVRFRGEQLDVDKINVGRRVSVLRSEATATSIRRGVKTSKIKLNPVDVVTPFEISSNFRMENIQGESVEQTIIRMMSVATANDMEEMGLEGDKLGPAALESDVLDGGSSSDYVVDSYMGAQDGWLKLARSGHIVDAAGANISSNVFSKLIKAMPDKWRRVRRNIKFFLSTDHEQNYRQTVSARATAAGDVALSTTQNLTPFGIELVPLPLLQTRPKMVEHVTLTGTTPAALFSTDVTNVVATLTTLGDTPTAPIAGSDLDVVEAAGTIARSGGSTLPDPVTVKVTYSSLGQVLSTEYRNLLMGLGRDVTILKDVDIYKDTHQYAIHSRFAYEVEEVDALALAKNVGLD